MAVADPFPLPSAAEKHLVLLRDGRTLIGYLRSIDQFGMSMLGGGCWGGAEGLGRALDALRCQPYAGAGEEEEESPAVPAGMSWAMLRCPPGPWRPEQLPSRTVT